VVTSFDDTRATAIIERAIELHMYTGDAVPATEAARIMAAEEIVQTARQVEQFKQMWEKEIPGISEADLVSRLPSWPACETILYEANVLVGSSNGHQTQDGEERSTAGQETSAPSPAAAPAYQPPQEMVETVGYGTQYHTTTQKGDDADAELGQSSVPSGNVTEPQSVVEAGAAITRDDPKAEEKWLDSQGNEWLIISYSGGQEAHVRKVATSEETMVPAGFLKMRKQDVLVDDSYPSQAVSQIDTTDDPGEREATPNSVTTTVDDSDLVTAAVKDMKAPAQDRYDQPEPQVFDAASAAVIDDFSGPYEFLSNFFHSPITINGILYPTVEHAFQAHKSLDEDDHRAVASQSTPGWAKKAGRALDLRPDWEDVKVEVMRMCLAEKFASGCDLARRLVETGETILVEGNTWGDTYWGVYNGEGENWLGKLLMERRQELLRPPQKVDSTPLPDSDDEHDAQYHCLLDETARRYTPAGWVVPSDPVDPPSPMPDDLTEIDDKTARRLHSQFNALAARARYLHDVEQARARGCDLVRKLHLRRAKHEARASLAKSATETAINEIAESDEQVSSWTERKQRHSEEAEAFKTFFDIYTQNVVVLSRDWTMRDKQVQN
jgi:N-glycosidase YbiA